MRMTVRVPAARALAAGARRCAAGVLFAAYCASSVAAGILKLSRPELTLESDKPPGELWVENVGDTPLYLTVSQELVTNPGHMPEQRAPIDEVPRPGLLVTPNRLSLAPGQKYRMTLKAFAVPEETQVWRVTFRPNERIRIEGRDAEHGPAPLFVSVGYGAVIYHLGREKR
ncbi:hypothetical protein L0Z42_19600 [Burkholderia multivorans]|uniref:hypothetical protein n=1 Tax=Burkholderia multivorans TaxID=87883 RepID=UPI00201A0551|nr:hypothetical protein [Burkholderia multivorans]MCO1372709.1 hypothetical protein [Burkholderia multivorans]MCO1456034.1 hypothetical protein [Burkholderia multivorans]MCO1470583.1 hypothetical protein [Burkholderia multivorans]UQO19790.1 hypothetical protein L0Z02_16955 [Burkholderia multivorans]UQO82887.1 hypothetical protein L0Y86_00735 [Burkholderia multivorans]